LSLAAQPNTTVRKRPSLWRQHQLYHRPQPPHRARMSKLGVSRLMPRNSISKRSKRTARYAIVERLWSSALASEKIGSAIQPNRLKCCEGRRSRPAVNRTAPGYKKKYPMIAIDTCVATCVNSDANNPLIAEEKRRPGRNWYIP